MATVARTSTKVQHYASLIIGGEEVYGIATRVDGGYSFRPDRVFPTRVVSYADPNLMLYGRVDLSEAQRVIDQGQGGLVYRTSRTMQALYGPGGAGTDDAPDMQTW
jgi:hypothetical protein